MGYFRKQQNETGYFCGMTLNLGKKTCRCQEKPQRHAFDSVFEKLVLLWFAFVFKVSGYFYKQLLLQNDYVYRK